MTPLFLKVNPPKQFLNSNQNKGPHLGSRTYTRIVFLGQYSYLLPNNTSTKAGPAHAGLMMEPHLFDTWRISMFWDMEMVENSCDTREK